MGGGKTGKLTWAGRALVTGELTGPALDDEVVRDCAAFGIAPPANTIPARELWSCHVAPLNAFAAVGDQWRVRHQGNGSRFMGLDYAAVKSGLKLADIGLTADEWADFRVIEGAVKAVLNGD